jgi:hypothetical protein
VATVTTDIKRAQRRARRLRARAARDAWANQFAISIELSWPKGALAWLVVITWLLAPIGAVILGIRLGVWWSARQRGDDGGQGGAA